jgi:MFS family permease
VSFIGAPEVQVEYGLRYGMAALILFALPQLLSFLLEPPLFLLADRFPRKPFVVAGLATLGGCLILSGLTTSLPLLACALALSWPASGVGVNLAQATLMDLHPGERERTMARWAFMGGLGDLATPALFAALGAVALGWREAFLITGALCGVYALVLLCFKFPAAIESGDALPPLRQTVRAALRNRRLLTWLSGVALCGMLDEVLVAFAALHLKHSLDANVATRSLVLAGFVVGGLGGLIATDRLLRRIDPLRLLRWAGASCAACYLAWIIAPGVLASGVLLTAVGFFAAPLYPIAKAQAYRALPGQSGLVIAGAQLFAPFELALPLLIGLAADAFGLSVALMLLVLQPLGILAIAVTLDRK